MKELQLAHEVLTKYPDQPDKPSVQLARAVLEQTKEIDRLTACLAKANANHEEFERRWYLMTDERDVLRARVEAVTKPSYIVTIQDKSLYGEPDVALAIVVAADETEARRAADATINELAAKGRGRCVPHARQIDHSRFYRLGALVRVPHDPNKEDDA